METRPPEGLLQIEDLQKVIYGKTSKCSPWKENLQKIFFCGQKSSKRSAISRRPLKVLLGIEDLMKVFYVQKTCRRSSIDRRSSIGFLSIELPLKPFYELKIFLGQQTKKVVHGRMSSKRSSGYRWPQEELTCIDDIPKVSFYSRPNKNIFCQAKLRTTSPFQFNCKIQIHP